MAVILAAMVGLLVASAASDDVISVETLDPSGDVIYVTPSHNPDVFFADHFDDSSAFERRWTRSKAVKAGAEEAVAKYDGEWAIEPAEKDPLSGDQGLVMKSKAKHSAIAAPLSKVFRFNDKPLVVQYELNFQNGQECGGGYIKLLSHGSPPPDLENFGDTTPYTIMFGPDKCGSDAKLHFIFRHVNPKNKTISEKHCKKLETRDRGKLDEVFKDKRPHLYRLVVKPDNSFEVYIDYALVNSGTLVDDFEPPVNPPAEIDDPADSKPADWDDREKIPDPAASKPDDWDESEPMQILDEAAVRPDGWLEDESALIPDEQAERPDDWDNEMDGEWEAPLVENPACSSAPGCGPWQRPKIDNPKYKGRWSAPLVNNPNYKGKWRPRRIPNPDHFHDPAPFRMTAVSGLGIELWSMSDALYFDNLLVTDDVEVADGWARDTFDLKLEKLGSAEAGLFRRLVNYSNQNPWLYAVYVVVVGLPLVLIVTFCCAGKPAKPESEAKKTDDVQPDDQVDEDEKVASEDNEDDDSTGERKSSPRRRRARKDN